MARRWRRWALLVSLLAASTSRGVEICDDCQDDDRDGAVDCWDVDCLSDPACGRGPLDARSTDPGCTPTLRLNRLWSSDLGQTYTFYASGDVDGDGRIEVVFTSSNNVNVVYVLDGATGALKHQLAFDDVGTQAGVRVALGDVDSDGTGEIFVGRPYEAPGGGALARLEHDLSSTFETFHPWDVNHWSTQSAGLSLADFDEDGSPEVYMLGEIFDAADGRVLVELGDEVTLRTSSHSLAADVFPDDACTLCAGLELVTSSAIYAVDVATGAWARVGAYEGGPRRGTFAVVDWNGDGRLDVVTDRNVHGLGGSDWDDELFAWDPRTGLLISPVESNYGYSAGIPLVADFDGDPEPEVARLEPFDTSWSEHGIVLRDHDFSVIWRSRPMENSAWCTGVLFDFDLDGIPDIALRGTSHVAIYDGLDGSVMVEADCTSGTTTERILVADLDGDGQTDLLAGCDQPERLIAWTVEGSPGCRGVMNQFQYYPFVVNDDLTIPCHQQDSASPAAPAYLNRSIQQAPLLRDGRTPSEECRCPVPASVATLTTLVACGGGPVTLDASSASGCTGGRLYRWVDDDGVVACDWSPSPLCDVAPSGMRRYVVTVACDDDDWCRARGQVVIAGAEGPEADAGPDASVCPGGSVLLDGRASRSTCAREYRWSDASGIVRDWDADATYLASPTGARTYTLDVRCAGVPDCVSSDALEVGIDSAPIGPAVGASLRASEGTEDSVRLSWCAARAPAAHEHVHVYRSDDASAPLPLVAPSPHALDFTACEWTDTQAPGSLYFYDVRYATCTERITSEPWRIYP